MFNLNAQNLIPGRVALPTILEPHEGHMDKALQCVAADPLSNRRVGILLDSASEHDHRDHHEGHVPCHVQCHHKFRVGLVDATLIQLTHRRLMDHGRVAAVPEEEDQDGKVGDSIRMQEKE
ncbi:hypothetical protein VNO78_23755 [Psophocarpus tetragonolobus]|uniref:Uncharacterized protein n=1 Tax=Psophocarpus tetragonolobus TaxID=3891 RepID=A0AAN9S4Q7_PSOTE